MIELLGKMPKNLAISGKNSRRFFDKRGCLRRIQGFHYWDLKRLLMEKYRIKESEAKALASFLLPMLEWYPDRRATAGEMLNHPWLSMPANYDCKMTEKEHYKLNFKKSIEEKVESEAEEDVGELIESDHELNNADGEDNSLNGNAEENTEEEEYILPAEKKYSMESELLNVDHGPNPQFRYMNSE
jgi:serine/threonine-protein kinase SRPK3